VPSDRVDRSLDFSALVGEGRTAIAQREELAEIKATYDPDNNNIGRRPEPLFVFFGESPCPVGRDTKENHHVTDRN
jgi:hypothetical protein